MDASRKIDTIDAAAPGGETSEPPAPRDRLAFNWIEVHVASHCNIRCDGCAHHSPFLAKRYYDLEQFRRDMRALGKVARVNLLRLMGGEPLLNPQLPELIEAAKSSGFSKLNSVSTNGVLLAKASDRFFDLVDYIFVSLYPPFEKNRAKIEDTLKAKSRGRRFTFNVISTTHFYDIELRGVDRLSDEEAQQSYRNCDRVLQGQFVEDGYFYKCHRPVSTGEYLRNRGYQSDLPDFRTIDGVAIHEPDLHGRMKRYMASETCLESCYYCTMGLKNQARISPWRRFKYAFEFNNFLQDRIYRSRSLLHLTHAFQDVFDRRFSRKMENRGVDIGVPLTPHRLLSAEEVRPRS